MNIKKSTHKITHKFKTLKRPYQVLTVLLIFFIPVMAYASWYYYRVSKPANLFNPITPEENEEYEWDAESYFNRNIVNIALLGFDGSEARDDRYSVYRTDTIKVASINFDDETINIIDIPRDIYTQIGPTPTLDKINHSFYFGWQYGGGLTDAERHQMGIEYTLKSISNVLGGIPLNYYVAVDMDAVVTLVDSLGGVRFDMPFDLYTTKNKLVAAKGEQLLDGYQYLWFLRTRAIGGDVGRVQRQTDLLKATLTHIRSEGLVKNIPTLYNSYEEVIDTNLTTQQIIGLAMYASDLTNEDINSHTISGKGQSSDGIYYMVMDQQLRADIIKAVFGIDFALQPQQTLTDTTPGNPTSFVAQVLTEGGPAIRLTWQPGSHNNEYNLYRSTNGGGEVRISNNQSGRTYTDQDVQPGNSYRYRLEAVNRRAISGSVSASATIEAKTQTPIDPPDPNPDDDDNNEEPADPDPTDPTDPTDPGDGDDDDDDNDDDDNGDPNSGQNKNQTYRD